MLAPSLGSGAGTAHSTADLPAPTPPDDRVKRRPGTLADYCDSGIARGVEFGLWAAARSRRPTAQEIRDRFHCSRPTAYRLLSLFDRYFQPMGVDRA